MDKNNPIYQNLQRFANDHKLILEDHGEVGFGRPCVGFIKGHGYVDYQPYPSNYDIDDFKPIPGFNGGSPPETVPDAYHKHDCLAVLVRNEDYDEALRQLNLWVQHMEGQGEVEVKSYETGARGIQAVVSGYIGYAVNVK